MVCTKAVKPQNTEDNQLGYNWNFDPKTKHQMPSKFFQQLPLEGSRGGLYYFNDRSGHIPVNDVSDHDGMDRW